MKYNQPFGISDPNAPYIDGNPPAGIQGSIPPAASLEFAQREVVNVITYAGLTPSNLDLTQLRQAIQAIFSASGLTATEGVKLVSNVLSSDTPGLTEEDTLAGSDLFEFYQTVTEGGLPASHHRKTTFANIAAKILSQFSSTAGSALLLNPLFFYMEQQRAIGVGPQALPNNVWTTWLLNTVGTNQIPSASVDVSTGYVTLPLGTYRLTWEGNCNNGGAHHSRIYNRTASTEIWHGLTCDSYTGVANPPGGTTNSSGNTARVVLTGATVISLDHFNNDIGDTQVATMGDNSTSTIRYDAFLRIEKELGLA